jgi:serine/threonine protein kinase
MEDAYEEALSSNTAQELSDIFNKMSPENISKFAAILSKGIQFNINELTDLIKEDDEIYAQYQEFFQNHSINFEAGSNSKNFSIVAQDQTEYILKLENRLNAPKEVDIYVREEVIPDIITPIYASCDTQYTTEDGRTLSGTIILTKLCEEGSLEDIAKTNLSNEQRTSLGLEYFTQMSQILNRISNGNCFFADMKNANWLVDEKGRIYIADTKSFLYTTADGIYDPNIEANEGYSLLKTSQFSPDEFFARKTFSANKAHIAILGKNLYQFLTGCAPNYLEEREYNFNKAIFKTGEGTRLRTLIERTTKSDPDSRPSMNEVLTELNQISDLIALKDEATEVLKSIANYNLDINADQILKDYIRTQLLAIQEEGNTDNLERKKLILNNKLTSLRDNTLTTEILNFINTSLDSLDNFPSGLTEQIIALKNELLNIPLDKRGSNTEEVQKLKAKTQDLQECSTKYLACIRLLEKIELHRISADDTEMNKFIEEKKLLLEKASSPNEFKKIEEELFNALKCMEDSIELIDNIKQVIAQFKTDTNPLKRGKKAKGDRIESALCAVPIEERKDILIANTSSANKVRSRIAEKRDIMRQATPKQAPAEKLEKWLDRKLLNKAIKIRDQFKKDMIEIKNADPEQTEKKGAHNAPKT